MRQPHEVSGHFVPHRRRHRIRVEEQDQIDVGGIVQLAAAELSES